MITDAGKWLEISTFRHLSCLVTGLFSVLSNVSANNCRLCWQRAVFLPATFQAGDDQSLSKADVMAETGSIHGFCASSGLDGWASSQTPNY